MVKKRNGKKIVAKALKQVRLALGTQGALRLSKKGASRVVADCRQAIFERPGSDGQLRPLVAGRLATDAVLKALKAADGLEVSRIGTTDIVTVNGVTMRVHAVCNSGVYVLTEPKNKVSADAVIAVRVVFDKDKADMRKVKLVFLGCRAWDEVARPERFTPAGTPIPLPPTSRYPRGGHFAVSKDCYAVRTEVFAA